MYLTIPKYRKKILLGDFNEKVGREDFVRPTNWNDSLQEISNNNRNRVVNFATSKNLTVKSTMFPHHNMHKFTHTSPDGKSHNMIGLFDVQSLGAGDCDTDHYLVGRD
jgi:hypothetical protein